MILPMMKPDKEKPDHLEEALAEQKRQKYVAEMFQGMAENLLKENDQLSEEVVHVRRKNEELAQTLLEMTIKAERDSLTGLLNRGAFDEIMGSVVEQGTAGVLMYLDIDNFKQINDTYGHTSGDEVLRGVAKFLHSNTRPTDLIFRLGGEEIAVFFVGSSVADIMNKFAVVEAGEVGDDGSEEGSDRDRNNLGRPSRIVVPVQVVGNSSAETSGINAKVELQVTFSGGLVDVQTGRTLDELVDRADKAMYKAKQSGKNHLEVG